ncbi:uncharacterized protein LOC131248071 [Magnolia sinica]|uniref:uncharacterized protein LOC131248071 n=1 Tax=Magnolia sinica TaxID=86752 RepID=UPI002657DF50|nr:uncharacterized protein LOC131248071 [Magnolia sinica]
MEALRASYDSTSDSDSSPKSSKDSRHISNSKESDRLPPPPIALIQSPPPLAYCQTSQESRVRSFPHVEGNYALHVFIPVLIPPVIKKELILALKRVASLVPSLHAVDVDIPLSDMCKDDGLLEQFLGREFHISLGRTVPIRVHQIGSVVTMLRQKLQSQNRYWIDFSKWEVFVNDDQTRSFLSMEVTAGGLSEITRQIHVVNDVYKLHNLPEFYENARPHISLAWALGDINHSLRRAVEELKRQSANAGSSRKQIFTCKFSGIESKIGKKSYKICKIEGQ